jgi:hypothetical protein
VVGEVEVGDVSRAVASSCRLVDMETPTAFRA